MTHVTALVGIDGCGKTTAHRRMLAELVERGESVAAIACPSYHDIEGTPTPMASLSRQLAALSDVADELGSFALKGIAMYLQMTLYGPIARQLIARSGAETLLSERHPLVDTLAYGPLYARASVQSSVLDEQAILGRLQAREPGAANAVGGWLASEGERLGEEGTLAGLAERLPGLFGLSGEELLVELARRFQTQLPDKVILLDIEPKVAAERLAQRSGGAGGELHERLEMLTRLRQAYLEVAQRLPVEVQIAPR